MIDQNYCDDGDGDGDGDGNDGDDGDDDDEGYKNALHEGEEDRAQKLSNSMSFQTYDI